MASRGGVKAYGGPWPRALVAGSECLRCGQLPEDGRRFCSRCWNEKVLEEGYGWQAQPLIKEHGNG